MSFEEGTKKGRSEILSNFGPSVARQAGIEPTTPWFVARYSIQLSYWRNRGSEL